VLSAKHDAQGKTVITGWAKTSVDGFELLGVRGLAKPYKVDIGGGIFDDSNNIRFNDDGTIETKNTVVLTNLSLSEPANGPIRSALKLPAPIDVAIGAVTDSDGSITLDLPVTIEEGSLQTDGVFAPVIGAISKVLVTAIASAPLKAAESVTSVLGLGSGKQKAQPPVDITFLPGVATLESSQARQLAVLAAQMKKDDSLELQLRHNLSAGDVSQLAKRANPSTDNVQLIVAQLRQEKSQLLDRRTALAAQAKAQFAMEMPDADATVMMLQSTDRQLAQIEPSLNQFLDLLRPGAANQTDRRTRAACLAVARERLDLIESALRSAGVQHVETRVHRTNPQFAPSGNADGGDVLIVLVPKKH
jgi:hypothetical protein